MSIQYLAEIKVAAAKYNLDYKLVMAFVQTESAYNPWACRFEPDFYRTYAHKFVIKGGLVTPETERTLRCTSFGLMQIMGETARELGFAGPYLPQLCDPATGLEYGCKLLRSKIDRFWKTHGNNGVISAYNAGSPAINGHAYVNQGYINTVNRNWAALRARKDV